MRRKDREITDVERIQEILDSCKVVRIAMCVDNIPYIVPLNFGYEYKENHFQLYFHCAKEGKKIDMIKQNNTVSFEMDCNHKLTIGENPCGYGYNYKSIIGIGKVEFIEDNQWKKHGFNLIMKHQTDKGFTFTEEEVANVCLCKINVSTISGKERRV